MQKKDDTIREEWTRLDDADIQEICDKLRGHEQRIQDYLIDCVASICEVDKSVMMTENSKVYVNHARWLFWYSYRYMTGESFGHIVDVTLRYGRRFTEQGITIAVNKMSKMIANNTIWTKRWTVIKRIIKLRDNSDGKVDNTIFVQVPKELKDKVDIVIKTK